MSSYRALFARPRARVVAVACGLGWLSFSSYVLAIVLAVEDATNSFAVAGTAVASFTAGSAALAPIRGRTVDRRGPRALLFFTPIHLCALLVLAAGCAAPSPRWLLIVSAGVAGTFAPPLIGTARAVWTDVSGPELARTGHAVNAALGDAAQVVGPALTGLVAVALSPLIALAVLIPGVAAATLLLAASTWERPLPSSRRTVHRIWGALHESAGLRTVLICQVGLGIWLGALEVAAPAVAASGGTAELGALPLSAFAAASVASSLWSGRSRHGRDPLGRYLAGSISVACVLPTCLFVPSLAGITLVATAAGVGFGLLNTALFQLLDTIVDDKRAVEAFTWITTGQGAGLAIGSAGAGHLAHTGGTTMLLFVALPPAVSAIVAVTERSTLRATAAGQRYA